MDGSPVPCALNDEAGNITFLNQAFTEILGYTLDDIPHLDSWWPKAYPNVEYRKWVQLSWLEEMERAKRQNTKFNGLEFDIRCKDGNQRTFIINASELDIEFKGEHLVTLFDITDRKRFEKEKESHQNQYKVLFDSAEVAIWNEDLSLLYREIERLKRKNINNIRLHLTENIPLVHKLASLIKVVNVNKATLSLFEAGSEKEFLNSIERSFGRNALEVFINEVCALWNKETIFRSEVEFKSFKGKTISAIISTPIPQTFEESKLVPVSILDISDRVEVEFEQRFHSQILNTLYEGVYLVRAHDLSIVFANPRLESLFAYQQGELLGKSLFDVSPASQAEMNIRKISRSLEVNETWTGELRHRKKTGDEFWCSANISKFLHPQFGLVWVVIVEDISERKKNEHIIWQQANYDCLTKLPNRSLLVDRINREVKEFEREGSPFTLLFIDLDDFKDVNDTLGHSAGDQLLLEAAKRIASCVREKDTIARFGGDEFTVLLTQLGEPIQIQRICDDINNLLHKPYLINNDKIYISGSIGVTVYPNDTDDIETLFKYADQAMYQAKSYGRNCARFFTKDLQQQAINQRELNIDLRAALAAKEFELYYQPIVDLSNNRISKAEVLIRWNHPTRGLVFPDEFIPLAEKAGLIIELGEWIIHQALAQLKRFIAEYGEFQLSINKSPIQFRAEKQAGKEWSDIIHQYGLPGSAICVEITENTLLNKSSLVAERLLEYARQGIQVALDDFGTGYSSLSYIKKFDVDYIKIDRVFVKNLIDNSEDQILCEAVIAMSHRLGIKVVAEGVETKAQQDFLTQISCDYVQGYYYSKPVCLADFKALLASW